MIIANTAMQPPKNTIRRRLPKGLLITGRWFKRFADFCRIALAASFLPTGIVKIMGERFAEGLPSNNPLGHYFDALYLTGYYYTFIGITQVIIAILLLFRRTSLLGALMYFSYYH